MSRRIDLIKASFPGRPAFDTAYSRALLVQVAGGEARETLRLYRPDPVVVFGRQDASVPGFSSALEGARQKGFASVLRLVGGRAAVFHEQTIAFAHTIPDRDPHSRTLVRFREMASLLAAALEKIGLDARVGEIPGEYCPGEYSVNARGEKKIAGIGQRIVRGAAHVGGVIVVDGAERVRDVLIPVYRALDLEWDPATSGSVAEENGRAWEEVEQAVIAEFAERYEIGEVEPSQATLERAEGLEPDHRV